MYVLSCYLTNEGWFYKSNMVYTSFLPELLEKAKQKKDDWGKISVIEMLSEK